MAKGTAIALMIPALPGEIKAALTAIVSYMVVIDEMGGAQGVDVAGVIGATGSIVTPRGSGAYSWLVNGANLAADAGKTIGDFILKLTANVTIPTLAVLVALGAPGAALITILKEWFDLGSPPADSPDALNKRGSIKADRGVVGPWETFIMADVGGGKVALLSWQGFFSAQLKWGNNNSVYANRPWVKAWELWTLVRYQDGTVTFKTIDGVHCFGQSAYADHSCFCDQNETSNPGFTRFKLEFLGGGQIALKTVDNKYVSVQPGA